jgi:hypothetical protein
VKKICTPDNQFALNAGGYWYFDISVKVFLKMGRENITALHIEA